MKSIKDIGSHKNNIGNKVIPLSLALVILVVSTSPISSLQFIKPAMAAGLTSVAVIPADNIVNTRTTYVVIFNTATSATVKSIEMTFPVGFDLSAANRVIERTGIGSGSLSNVGNEKLVYTLNNAESVPAGTKIRLEIGRVVNSNTTCNCQVTIATLDAGNTIIDQKLSPSFPIKAIEGLDIDPNFMVRKTLLDDDAGHFQGWDPDLFTTTFNLFDSDISGPNDNIFVSVAVTGTVCTAGSWDGTTHQLIVKCDIGHGPNEGAILQYVITKLPAHVVTSSLSASSSIPSSPFDSLLDK